ncbi:SDR family oxidoreductase [Pedobacter antarcticus]|uniref:SDR family oxidoreductase n=1 Tax=Pedobacter antarcticus TaxID=34086 RepID=UPI00292DF9FB|nr:SDR family oxidoreductase [Pedobacter antarcticus]
MYRTVVITGASSGAGRAIAYEFALRQDNLVLASRNISELEEVKAECESMGGKAICIYTDVTSYGDMINLASAATDFGGNIDIWINNAGVLAAGAFEDTPVEVLDQVIRTNLMGYIHGAHAVLPYFKSQGRGILINNISIGGFLPVPYGAGYSASKFGLRGFSAALRAELTDFRDIYVCDAYPAFLDTPGIQHAANYTGKSIRPAPPVYDPARLAIAIAELAGHPKSEVMVGSASILLRYAYAFFPALTSRITAKVIGTYLNRAEPIEKIDGNIFNTVKYGNAVHGGWGVPGKPKAHRKYIAAGLLLFSAAGLLLLRKK